MSEIVSPQNVQNPGQDPRWLGIVNGAMTVAPTNGWASRPVLQSSDVQVYRNKENFSADARDAARANPYGRSARRATVDSVIGSRLTLSLMPKSDILGVSDDEAREWSDYVEELWEVAAESSSFHMDAQRKQTFSGLMRTAYDSFYVSGETLATIEAKESTNGQLTCLLLIAPERLSDPRGMQDIVHGRRMGVERDIHGAPIAYHIRERHPSDSIFFGPIDHYKWKRIPRTTKWGRANVLHYFEQDQPDMTRGISSFTSALLAMRLLQDYMLTELETAAVQATYAAVIQSKLDYNQAMQVIGSEYANAIGGNPLLDFTMRTMADKATFYRGQDFHFGKSKVAHLLPDEELKMVQGGQNKSGVRDFSQTNLYTVASALGVDYASLTKDYSSTNYSGARTALHDVWRSYEVRREAFIQGVPWPFFTAWLEEQIVWRKTIPMLGKKSFFAVKDAVAHGSFETWSRPRLDPLKENQADALLYKMGAISIRDICKADGRDWTQVYRQRKIEKEFAQELGLEPQDLNPELLMNIGADNQSEGAESEGGASSGSSPNG